MPANPFAALRNARCDLTWGASRLWWEMCGPCTFATTYRNGLHQHSRYFEICSMISGHGVQTHTDQTVELNPGDLFLARPGVLHEIISDHTPAIELVFFNVGVVDFRPDDPSVEGRMLRRFLNSRLIHSRGGDVVHAQLLALARSLEQRAADQDTILEFAVRMLVCEVFRRMSSPAAAAATAATATSETVAASQVASETAAADPGPAAAAGPEVVLTAVAGPTTVTDDPAPAPAPAPAPVLAVPAVVPGPPAHDLLGPSRALEQALRFLDDNLARPISCQELARQAGVSERSLRRLFEEHLHTTPGQEYLTRRMRYAAHLLDDPQRSIHAAGAEIGITDPSQFSRDFRRVLGLTPTQYRQKRTTHVTYPQAHLE